MRITPCDGMLATNSIVVVIVVVIVVDIAVVVVVVVVSIFHVSPERDDFMGLINAKKRRKKTCWLS